jgi:hypothetical protein
VNLAQNTAGLKDAPFLTQNTVVTISASPCAAVIGRNHHYQGLMKLGRWR